VLKRYSVALKRFATRGHGHGGRGFLARQTRAYSFLLKRQPNENFLLLKQVPAELGIDIPPKQSWAKLVLIALKRYSIALKRFATRERGMAMVGVAFSLGNHAFILSY
jgi:hypothetical protein